MKLHHDVDATTLKPKVPKRIVMATALSVAALAGAAASTSVHDNGQIRQSKARHDAGCCYK